MNSEDVFISSIWKLIGAFLCFLFLATLITDGMFVDGLWYATISRNLAIGQGTWFAPQFTQTLHQEFYEHPPMMFWLQSLFYRVLGDHYWVERIFCIVILLKTVFTLKILWYLTAEDQLRKWFCIPILAWILLGDVHRGYGNNLLEPTMTLFCLWSVIFQYYAIKSRSHRRQILFACLSGASIIGAFLTKGPPGLFPLAFIPIYILMDSKQWKKKSLNFFYLIVSIIIFCSLLYFVAPGLVDLLMRYMDQQVISALEGQRFENIQSHRWQILLMLLPALLIFAILPIIIKSIIQQKLSPSISNYSKHAIILISLGLSASIPLMVSIKQASYYLIPALPFLALGISQIFLSRLKFNIKSNQWVHWFNKLSWVLLIVGIIYSGSQFGKYDRRDKELIQAIDEITIKLPDQVQTIGYCCPERLDGYLHGYFYRYHKVSIDEKYPMTNNYLITSGKEPRSLSLDDFIPIELNSDRIHFWLKNQ